MGKLRKMCIVLNPRGYKRKLRVGSLPLYYPTERTGFLYIDFTVFSKPVVLTRFGAKHDTHFEQQVHNLVCELRNFGKMRGISPASFYPFFSSREKSFKYSKYYLDLDFKPQISEVKTNTTLVNAFEIWPPCRNPIYWRKLWT